MFGWFRKYVRKIGIFGVEVEFHPPTETTVTATPAATPRPSAPFEAAANPQRSAEPRDTTRQSTAQTADAKPGATQAADTQESASDGAPTAGGLHRVVLYRDAQMEAAGFTRQELAAGLDKAAAEALRDRERERLEAEGYTYCPRPQLS